MSGLSFSTEQLETLFPFFLMTDTSGVVRRVGPSLKKTLPQIDVGSNIDDFFAVDWPDGSLPPSKLTNVDGKLFALRTRVGEDRLLLLRGQFVAQEDGRVFVGAPWVREVADIKRLGLSIRDFAVHDPISDYLLNLQTNTASMRDSRRLTAKLEQARAVAENASRAKTEFLASMSHEIRTPLNVVMGMAELLTDTELTRTQRLYVDTILGNSEQLRLLVSDVLDVSKIEAAQIELESVEFDIGGSVEAVVESLAIRAEDKHLELTVYIDEGTPSRVLGDPARIRQIATNLVGNAVKFTTSGHVTVNLLPIDKDEDEEVLRLVVSDSGPGIAADKTEAIFDRFVQENSSTNRRFGGTGLGLHITRSLTELMGGSIRVDSTLGSGSTFVVELPLKSTSAPAPGPAIEGERRILVSSTGSPSRANLTRRLQDWGFETSVVNTPQEALERSAGNARLIIIEAPHTGPEYIEFEKSVQGIRDSGTPLIVIDRAGMGANDEPSRRFVHITRPTSRGRLLGALETILGTREGRRSRGAPAPKKPRAEGTILLAEDNPANQLLISRLLEFEGYSVEVANDGLEAVQMATNGSTEYRAVLMDLEMPRQDGLESARQIREWEKERKKPPIPIIALTAHALESHRQASFEGGMQDFLTKPVERTQLMQRLRVWTSHTPVVLVVDDSLDSRLMLEHMLRDSGQFRPLSASNGAQGIRIAELLDVDIVLLDLVLPDMSGFELARTLRARLPRAGLLMLTGRDDAETVQQALDSGCAAHLSKPARRGRVLQALAELTPARYRGEPKAPMPARVKSPTLTYIEVDKDLMDLIPGYLKRRREEAQELSTRIVAQDFEWLKNTGHNLKGSGAGYGFKRLTEIGQSVEAAAKAQDIEALKQHAEELDAFLSNVRTRPGS